MVKAQETTGVNSNKKIHTVAMWLFTAVLAFIASMGKVMGYPSPVNVVIAVISGVNVIPAFLGSVLSYFVFGNVESGIVQLCSILVIAGIRSTVFQGTQKDNPIYLSLLTSGIMLLFSCVLSVAIPGDAYTTSLRMLTSLICGCLVFVSRSIQMRYECDGVFDIGGFGGVFSGIIYIMLVSTLAACQTPLINVGRTVGTFAILVAVKKYKTTGGAVVGALTTCGILLCDPTLARNTLLLATSGLICGAFIQFGLLIAVLVFIGISIVSLVAMGINADTFYMFADIVAGSIVYIACPTGFLRKMAAKFLTAKSSVDLVGQTASSRLNFASKTLSDIRGQISLVSAAIDKKTENCNIKVKTCSTICGECELFTECWKKSCEKTKKAFINLENIAIKYNGISSSDVEKELPKCCKSENLTVAINDFYKSYLTEKADNIRIKEMRELVSEQLASMEDILSDLSFRVSQVRSIDSSLSTQIRDYFSRLGYPNARVCVFMDENNSQRVEVYLTAKFSGDLVKLTTGISSIIECDFDVPVITQIENISKLSFNELPDFEVAIGTFQASCSDNEYSGDTLETLDLSTTEKYVVLSDGMGTGKRAKLDSMFAINLSCRLLKAGISMTTTHRLINSILRVKGWEESFATLDLLKIDLCGGSAEFLKAGAAPAYLYRDGALKIIGGQAFPAGILPDCVPNLTNCKLFFGDVIIMSSDGVSESVIRKIGSISPNKVSSPQKIAQKLGEKAMTVAQGVKRDDITIAVIYLSQRKK